MIFEKIMYGLIYNRETREIRSNSIGYPLGHVKQGKIYWHKKTIKRFQWNVQTNSMKP